MCLYHPYVCLYTVCCSYILMDWLAEVSEMKSFPSATVHLAVSLAYRYMLARSVMCSKLQLLGISALLVASR